MTDIPLPWDEDQSGYAPPAPVEPPPGPVGLHPSQREVFEGLKRFNVIAAGRRFGKTYLAVKIACWYLRHTHWADGESLQGSDVWYVSPTLDLGLETAVPMILDELGDECVKHHRVQNFFELESGARLYIKSAARPESLRGRALRAVILDEISIMPPGLWEMIIQPSLVSVRGHAVFIGTPVGKGKLWELFQYARDGKDPEWTGWQFKTVDNPLISDSEVSRAGATMTKSAFKQEFEADFSTGGGNVFARNSLKAGDYPRGVSFMAVVFGSDKVYAKDAHALSGSESALVVIRAHPLGWSVRVAQRGVWRVQEALLRISKAYDQHNCRYLAISDRDRKQVENLLGEFRKHHDFRTAIRYFNVSDPDDIDRIKWALQSRLKSGQLTCVKGRPLNALRDQLQDFPLEYSNSELVQALSYFDQLPQPNFGANSRNRFQPIDAIAGY